MTEELHELFENAIYKEIASEALYAAGQGKTADPGAKALMKELAAEEHNHSEILKGLRDKGTGRLTWYPQKVPDLKISDYLVSGDTLEGAGLQDTLIFAMKREQQAVEFYSGMMGMLRSAVAKRLARKLAVEELKHKLKLEMLYDDLFYKED